MIFPSLSLHGFPPYSSNSSTYRLLFSLLPLLLVPGLIHGLHLCLLHSLQHAHLQSTKIVNRYQSYYYIFFFYIKSIGNSTNWKTINDYQGSSEYSSSCVLPPFYFVIRLLLFQVQQCSGCTLRLLLVDLLRMVFLHAELQSRRDDFFLGFPPKQSHRTLPSISTILPTRTTCN